MFVGWFTKGIEYCKSLQVVSSFVDNGFNPHYAWVKNVVNKVSKTLEEVKFPPKNHYFPPTYN